MSFIEQLQKQFQVNLESFNIEHLSLERYADFKQFVVAELEKNINYDPVKLYLKDLLAKSKEPDMADRRQEFALLKLLCQTAAFFDTRKIERKHKELIDLICSGVINNNPIIILEVINIIQFAFQGIMREIKSILKAAEQEESPRSIQEFLSLFVQYKVCSDLLAEHNAPITLDQSIISVYNKTISINYQLSILQYCENTPALYLSIVSDAGRIKHLFSQIIQHNSDRAPSCFAPIRSPYELTGFTNIVGLHEVILDLFDKIAAAKDTFMKEALNETNKAALEAAFKTISTLIKSIEAAELTPTSLEIETASEPKPPPHTQLYQPATVAGKPAAADASDTAPSHTAVTPR